MTAAERVREAVANTVPDHHSTVVQDNLPPVAFGDHTVWIGGQALKRLVEQTEEQYPDDGPSEGPDGYPAAGLRQVEDVLVQFQDVMGVRVRLIFGTPDKPLHELDVLDVPRTQGQPDNDTIRKWLYAGASLIADTRDQFLQEAA